MMTLRPTAAFLQSRVARRMFGLFVLCALLPIVSLATVTYTAVQSRLAADTDERLRQASRTLGMAVSERLEFLEQELLQQVARVQELAPAGTQSPHTSDVLTGEKRDKTLRFLSVGLSDGAQVRSWSGTLTPPQWTEKDIHGLREGRTVLRAEPEAGGQGHIWFARATDASARQVVIGEVSPDYLWGIGTQDTLPAGLQLTVVAGGRLLATTHQAAPTFLDVAQRDAASRSTGAFAWTGSGVDYMAGFWTLPLGFRYATEAWTIVLSQDASDAQAPIRLFTSSFMLIVIVTLGLVVLLSSIYIRRLLQPLDALEAGTHRIAKGDFSGRVVVRTKDEFEALAESFNHMGVQLERQIAALVVGREIDQAILSSWDVSRIVEALLMGVHGLATVEQAGLLLFDGDSHGMARLYTYDAASGAGMTVSLFTLAEDDRRALGDLSEPRTLQPSTAPVWVRQAVGTATAFALLVPIRQLAHGFGWLVLGLRDEGQLDEEATGHLRRAADQVAVALSNAAEVARRKQAEDHLRGTNVQLEQAMHDLQVAQKHMVEQERLRALGEMASGITHDFNNALYPVIGFTELLLLNPAGLDNKEMLVERLKDINMAAMDASKIVRRLRDFYRPRDVSDLALPVDINELIRQTVKLTQPKWREQAYARGLTVEVRTELQPVEAIRGDDAELREVFTNLLFNAVDAMSHRGSVTFRSRMDGGQVLVEVADTGSGMTEEVRRRCLEPFFSTKGDKGTGLGLAMVYGIVRRAGGTLDIDSAVGRGTTFLLRFPVTDAVAVQEATVEQGRLPTGWRVLVVDADPLVGMVTGEYVRASGLAVEVVRNSLDALARCRTRRFDLVVAEQAMSDVNGPDLAALIKKLSPSTATVILSGAGDLEAPTDVAPDTIDARLDKPLTMGAFQSVLRQLASRPQSNSSAKAA